jgi:hypothetical protein
MGEGSLSILGIAVRRLHEGLGLTQRLRQPAIAYHT